jgi:triacylglycerol lipase
MKMRLSHIVKVIAVILLAISGASASDKGPGCVVLLHGLARSENSLLKLEQNLKKNGFCVVNKGYPSRENTIEELSVNAIPAALDKCQEMDGGKVHFVTHSMGGILVRYYLTHHDVPNLGRVVMLSPPNNGSEVVDKLRGTGIFEWINGPAGDQLGTDADSLPNRLDAPDYEVGIITGDRSINPILSILIPGKDDGKVSIENAKIEGMKDFLVVHTSHPFIMNDEDVFQQVLFFLKNGEFNRD